MSRCLYKKEIQFVSYNLGDSWYATGESRKGSLIAQGSSLCQEPSYKFQATYVGGATYNEECDSGTTLTQEDTQPSGYTCTRMTSAVIGDCITSIGNYAFQEMKDGYCFVSLRSVDIPNSVTTIGYGAFACCTNLSSITIPNSVTSIGEHAFLGCSSLSSVTIGSGVTSIGYVAFQSCTSLSSVTIPNSVTSIGYDAFYACTSLTSIDIPNSVTSIGVGAFRNCPSLSSMTVGSNNAVYDSRNNCNGIIETATNTLIAGCKNTVIPNTVTSIGQYAFYYCSGLTSVTLGSGVTSIGGSAFYGCSSLQSITINATTPPTLGWIAIDNTNDCPIYVPCASVNAYKTASRWSSYASRIEGIPPCGQPTGTKFSATYTGGTTYSAECNSSTTLTTTDTRPSGYEYSAMTSAFIGDCITSIGGYAFYECSGLTSIDIPDSVTSIDVSAFQSCSSLTSVTIPDSVTSIGLFAFEECTSLSSVTIPNSVTSIGEVAFKYCSSLTSVSIGSGVTSIGINAFYGCSSLTSLTVNAVTPPTLGSYAFDNTNNCPIYVPCESVDTYKSASGWSDYASRIQGIPPCGQPSSYKWLATYTGGTTSSADCDSTSAITENEITKEYLVSVEIGNCVTTIGNDAFSNCSYLTSIDIPNSVTSIGSDAFYDCDSLTSIDIPNSVISIGERAFYKCLELTSVIIPSGVTYIEDWTFGECKSLTSITIPNSVTSIGEQAFTYCDSLTSITIGSGVTYIGLGAIYDCISLTSITCLATTPPELGNYAFGYTNNCPIYVPAASVNAYKSAWSDYASRIQAIP